MTQTTKHTPLVSFPGYAVSRDGVVFSLTHNWRGYGERRLAVDTNDHGYASVRLTVNGKRTRLAVHKLVAEAFLPAKPNTPDAQIRHLDGNRMNPHADNLAWGTAADNAADRDRHGRTSRAVAHSHAVKAGIAASTNSYWRHAR
jgi:hypothetical protein